MIVAQHFQGVQEHETTSWIIGCDEVGRGPLAGPVVAAAVCWRQDWSLEKLTDSKLLSSQQREKLRPQICARSPAWAIAEISAARIDEMNILVAALEAMAEALETIIRACNQTIPSKFHVIVDGCHLPKIEHKHVSIEAIVKADLKISAVSAASILAKQYRDQKMRALAKLYPGYGFEQHFGYPTLKHRQALMQLGVCHEHRKSYAPVRKVLELTA